ncbi:SDR family oxidoreductase [Mucilaginibacter litoreus]|uniref:SDR family oxidoreductase n=1 Tax=Mucilaginibacter litoreus TaxID=1048221 RepID=A0ABW3APD1_9SPHI
MRISILGCGWFGLPLAKALITAGHSVNGSTTSENKLPLLAEAGITPFRIDLTAAENPLSAVFFNCDILVIAIPPKSRSAEGREYVAKLRKVIDAVIKHKVQKVILVSSTGIYADLNQVVNENNDPQPNTFAGEILLEAEELFKRQPAFKTTIVRFGGLVGPDRDPGRFFAGKDNIANGMAPVNLIHLDDCIGITQQIIEKDAFGYTINAVAPHHPTRADFYMQASAKSGLPLPSFVLELNEWKIVESVTTIPVLNYEYQVHNWYEWLNT